MDAAHVYASDADAPEGAARAATTYVLKLAEAAVVPSNDPCDLCEEAMPGFVLNELVPADRAWMLEHTQECSYCRTELACFECLDDLLDDTALEPRLSSNCVTASWSRIDSPIGDLAIAVSPSGVCEIGFGWMEDDRAFARRLLNRGFIPVRDDAAVEPVRKELADYFSGVHRSFDVPIDLSGVTAFSRAVLDATAAIPFGETRTYGDIARAIGKPGASRAVGNALNKNPIPLIVPCHRIVPTSGGIGNYAGSPQVKAHLLNLEGALPSSALQRSFL
jgi:methylated-DNA-[protein]-cysteine S-methyltransferase